MSIVNILTLKGKEEMIKKHVSELSSSTEYNQFVLGEEDRAVVADLTRKVSIGLEKAIGTGISKEDRELIDVTLRAMRIGARTIGDETIDITPVKYLGEKIEADGDYVKLSVRLSAGNSKLRAGQKARVRGSKIATREGNEIVINITGLDESTLEMFNMLLEIRKSVRNYFLWKTYKSQGDLETAKKIHLNNMQYYHLKSLIYNSENAQADKDKVRSLMETKIQYIHMGQETMDLSTYASYSAFGNMEFYKGLFVHEMFEYSEKKSYKTNIVGDKVIHSRKANGYTYPIKFPVSLGDSEIEDVIKRVQVLDTAFAVCVSIEDLQYEFGIDASFNTQGLYDELKRMVAELKKIEETSDAYLETKLGITLADKASCQQNAIAMADEIIKMDQNFAIADIKKLI